jgi:hypothetical protein
MSGPRRRNALLLALVSFVLALAALALAACGPATGQPLEAIHAEGQLENVLSVDRGLCLSCHNEHSIIDSTKDYGGQAALNIHQPPESMMAHYGDCATCHKLAEQPVLTCNSSGCHSFRLPKGWSA